MRAPEPICAGGVASRGTESARGVDGEAGKAGDGTRPGTCDRGPSFAGSAGVPAGSHCSPRHLGGLPFAWTMALWFFPQMPDPIGTGQ